MLKQILIPAPESKPTCSILFSRSLDRSSSVLMLSVACAKVGHQLSFGHSGNYCSLFSVFTDTPVLPKWFLAQFHSEDLKVEEPGCCSRCAENTKDRFRSKRTRYSDIPAPSTATCDNNICIINFTYYRNTNQHLEL